MLKVASPLATLFSALSIVVLARQAFNLGFAVPFTRILDFFEKSLRPLEWAEPYLSHMAQWAGWNLQLQPHWRPILVLTCLYFGTVTKVIWPKFKSRKERSLILVLTAWGGLIAIGSSIAAGAIALNDTRSNVVMVVFPLLGFVLYQLAWAAFLATIGAQESWSIRYRAAVRLFVGPGTLAVIVVALALCAFARKVPLLMALHNPGLTLLCVLILLLAIYWLWTGVEGAVYYHKPQDKSWWQAFRSMNWWESWRVLSNTRIGLSMFKCIGGAVLFVLFGAGLDF